MIDRQPWTVERLGDLDQLLARVIESSTDALVIVTIDGGLIVLNPAAERLLGIPRDQLTGRPYTDRTFKLLTLQGAPLPVDDWSMTRLGRTKGAAYDLQALFERPGGERIVLSVNASPLIEAAGEVTGMVVWLRDEMARTEAEDAAREQAGVLRAQAELLDLAHDAIFVRDMSASRILYWNRGAEEVYGYRRDEAVGRISHELLRTQFPVPLQEIEDTMVREGQWEGELVHCTRDGREVIIESRWTLQRDARGEPVALLEINRNITARKQAETALARSMMHLQRSYGEIDRRNRELAAINTSMASISQALDSHQVLQNIVDCARELIQARYAALGVADGQGHITQFITSGITPDERAAIGPLPEGHGLLGALIEEAKPLRVRDISQDPRGHGFPPNHPPMSSLLGVPILANGKVLGDLYLTDKIGADAFSEEDQTLLLTLAGHAAVAIENAQLYGDARAARDQMRAWNRDLEATVAERTREIERMSRELTARVLQAQEEERGRIARELHDETAQSLVKLLIDLDLLKPYIAEDGPAGAGTTRLEQGLKRTLDEVRALSHDLRPPILEDFGLAAAVRAYAEDWLQTFNVPVQVEVRPGPGVRLPMELEIALFRIAQEALMNAGKYARAREVHVILSVTHDTVELVVQDDGDGFNPGHLCNPSRQGGLGLYSMRERTALLGGSLTIDSAPGKGTRVALRAPIAEGV